MNSETQKHANLLRPLTVALCALAVIGSPMPANVTAAGVVGSFKARDIEIPVFLENSMALVATWRIASVYTDHRRIGFFRVKLLPELVAEGVRLEFDESNTRTNCLADFRFDLAPVPGRSVVELRDFSVSFGKESVPRLRASRCRVNATPSRTGYRLEGVALRAGSQSLRLPHAELRVEGRSVQVLWQNSGKTLRWDLFTAELRPDSAEQVELR